MASMENLQVYGIGNILIDILVEVRDDDLKTLHLDKGIMKLVDEEERSGILKHIESKPFTYNCGGSAPNTIINLAALGVRSALSGKIGKDDFGRLYKDRLTELGVRSYLSEGDNVSTGSSIVLMTPDAERTMNTALCANRSYSVENINPEAIREADYLYFTGYMWDTESQKKALQAAIDIAVEAGTKIAFDVADPFAVTRYKDDFLVLIEKYFDIVFANADECRLLFPDLQGGRPGPEDPAVTEGIKRLSNICRVAVVKNGSYGSAVKSGSEIHSIPVHKVKAADTTGAGDMYAAGFLTGICRGYTMDKAGLLGSWLASRIVEEIGAQFPSEKREKILKEIADGDWDFMK